MISLKVYFSEIAELRAYQHQSSRAFRIMYNNLEESESLKNEILQRHPLIDASIYDSLLILAKMKKSQYATQVKQKLARISLLEQEMGEIDVRTKRFHKINKQKSRLLRNIDSQIVFGGKINLQNLTYNKNMFNKTKLEKYQDQYQKYLKKYREQRILPYYSVGRACEKGNRKFNFDLKNKSFTFKPSKKVHFDIKFTCGKSQYKTLCILQEMADRNAIPITVSLASNYAVFTFDNEMLAGYAFDSKACNAEQKEFKDKEIRKQIYIKHREEQRARMLLGKKKDVYAGIDLNPAHIGFVVRNKTRILYTKCYDLSKLIRETKENKTDQIEFNLAHIYRDIFRLCTHFKVSSFVVEDLNFEGVEQLTKGVNRQVKNLWCRTFQTNLFNKYCQNLGIQLLEINPAYSSFVGNMTNKFYDCISAAAEITRRGMLFKKEIVGDWYIGYKQFLGDNLNLEMYAPLSELRELSVPALYKIIKSRNLKYRRLAKPKFKLKLIKCLTFTS